MKIVHFIYDSLENPWLSGGGAQRTQALYEILGNRHDITIVCGNYKDAPADIGGVKYKHIGWGKNYSTSRLTFMLLAWFYALRLKADIYVEDISAPTPLFLPLLHRNTVGSVQFIPDEKYIGKRRLVGRFTVKAFRSGLSKYKNLITVTKDSQYAISKFAKNSKIAVIENGVEVLFPNSHSRKFFLYLGRIDFYAKGLDILTEAATQMSRRHKDFRMIIAGDGSKPEVERLQRNIRDLGINKYVKYVGYLDKKSKYKYINNSIATVLPSRSETSSISSLESFALAKPVVGSSIGGLGEILNESGGALIVEPLNPTNLANNLEKLQTDKKLASKLGKNGKNYVANYSWLKIAKRYEALLMELSNG